MNIILVVFDSLRKDCMSVYGSPPWGAVQTPHFDAFAEEAIIFNNAYPESLPTLPARRALYTGQRVYPFHNGDFRLKGDFNGSAGWGPIPEYQPTLAELLKEKGYRTALISDLYHQFKPSKNYWRGFDQWMFLRGQETDPARSGPRLTQAEIDHWLPKELQDGKTVEFIEQCILNIRDRTKEEDFFAARVLQEASRWLEQNQDADNFFLTVESFDPHEPWLAPAHYRKMYQKEDSREQVRSGYNDTTDLDQALLKRTQANYSGCVTFCDRWFGHFMESLRVLGLLDNTLVILTSDHGHSIGDRNYMGKRGYPSSPEVYEIPLLMRLPGAKHRGTRSDMFVQFTDISATILEGARIEPEEPIDGKPIIDAALRGDQGHRDHVTIGWGVAPTVITPRWWFNAKMNGTGVLLHDLSAPNPFSRNVAEQHPHVVNDLFSMAKADGGGVFPAWLLNLSAREANAPGCSDLAARG
ncbi:MAG: sulfatase [Candidatus Hydrogenedentes bacterium]|nr:sulfatase [Candidatus Hydrogenedentota bacterium]